MSGRKVLRIPITREAWKLLRHLRTSQAMPGATVEAIVEYALSSLADGIRRPGSWEREVVTQLFGPFTIERDPCCKRCDLFAVEPDEPLQVQTGFCSFCIRELISDWWLDLSDEERSARIAGPLSTSTTGEAYGGGAGGVSFVGAGGGAEYAGAASARAFWQGIGGGSGEWTLAQLADAAVNGDAEAQRRCWPLLTQAAAAPPMATDRQADPETGNR